MILWLLPVISIVLTTTSTVDPAAPPEQQFEKKCSKSDPTSCRQTVVEGEVVPFSGQLMTPRRAARLGVMAGQCKERIEVAVDEATAPLRFDLALERALRADAKTTSDQQNALWERRYAQAEKAAERDWHENPIVLMVIGGLIVGGSIGIATAIISETRPSVVTVP